jgi:hypothetical protein
VEKIKRRFKNLRSAYGKLKNRAGSAGKSGQASCRLTSRQEWKLRNLAFLDEVIQPRTQGQELGRVSIGIEFVCVQMILFLVFILSVPDSTFIENRYFNVHLFLVSP